ncbi:XdhC family protein [Treponema pedis]|uniref:XdhC family protein n=1 Tax=Treponema pedis TaxID=409322 RepID=UPI00056FB022|nr:XdhC/CoxI family protein [Treponema pedis]
MIKIIEEARSLVLKKIPFIAATIIFKHGSAPREVGATMLVTEEGGYAGTIGGGSQEYEVSNHAVGLLKNKKTENVNYEVSKAAAANLGMVCGGYNTIHYQYIDVNNKKIAEYLDKIIESVEDNDVYLVYNLKEDLGISIEINGKLYPFTSGSNTYKIEDLFKTKIKNPMRVFVFGGGYIAKAAANLFKFLNLDVTVIDDRKDFIGEKDFPGIKKIIMDFSEIDGIDIKKSDYVCIMTRGHQHDITVLESVLKKRPYYVGVVGNKYKSVSYKAHFANTDLENIYNEKVHLPVGIKISALTPEEIAVSIAGEIIQSYRNNK